MDPSPNVILIHVRKGTPAKSGEFAHRSQVDALGASRVTRELKVVCQARSF
jgi:hypothetical protein